MGAYSQLLQWHVAAGCIAVALILVAFWFYNRNGSKISTGTWVILAIGDTLDLASYAGMTETLWKDMVPATFAIASIITFGYALARKRFAWPDPFDWFIVGSDALIAVWWWQFASATEANLLYQATTLIAFVPMYRGLIIGREKENPLPWLLWSLAFVFFFLSIVLKLGKWEETVYPIVGLLTHFTVYVLAKRKA